MSRPQATVDLRRRWPRRPSSGWGRRVATAAIALLLPVSSLVAAGTATAATADAPTPSVTSQKVTPGEFNGDLRKIRTRPPRPEGPARQEDGRVRRRVKPDTRPDPLAGRAPARLRGPGALSDMIQDFEGVNNVNGIFPPDTNGDVGPKHYIQQVNSSFQIYDKNNPGNGLLTAGSPPVPTPMATNQLFSTYQPSDSLCRTTNRGDGVVRHDPIADRWVITYFAFNVDSSNDPVAPYHECIAVSKTADPVTGGWHLYDFLVSNQRFNDYPKLGVWPDAYYVTFNWEGAPGAGGAYAFDRANMLNGNPAGFVCFGCDTGIGLNGGDGFTRLSSDTGMLPADFDGTRLPTFGAPATLTRITGNNTLRSFAFHVDWQVPANSTLTQLADVTVADFNTSLSGIPQPDTTQTLDPLSDRLMHRLQYRNFGTYESMVVNHTVNVDGAGHAGVRWYELHRPAGGANWILHQQGTFAPDAAHRWMGSIAMDKAGNMALGYSVSSAPATPTAQNPKVYPSIRAAARLAGDPLGLLPQSELKIRDGKGSQTGASPEGIGRWGDYSAMQVDPTDGCTFWYTTEYMQTTSNAGWQTRVASFKFPTCNPADVSITKSGSPSPAVAGAELRWNLVAKNNGPDAADNVIVEDELPAGDVPFSVTQPGCTITGQKVRCELGTLADGASVPIQIRSQVDPDYDVPAGGPTPLTDDATIKADQFDPDPADNKATASVNVNEQADLAVSKSCDNNVLAGQPGKCTVYVDNNGPSTARDVVLTDTATSDGTFTISSATASQGGCGSLPPPNQSSGTVTCPLGDIRPATPSGPGRATVVVSYTATEGQTVHDSATVTSDTPDPDSANNTQSTQLPITSLADLKITSATATPDPVTAGTDLTFSVTVRNSGPSTAQNVVLKDQLPAGVTVTSITLPSSTSCTAGVPGDPFQPAGCGLDLLRPGATATMTIVTRVKPTTTGVLHADASVTSVTLDPNNSDNYAHTDTTVATRSDLKVALADSPDPVVAGTSLTYTATITNNGPSTARTVDLTEDLDNGVTYQSASISSGGEGTCAQVVGNPHRIECRLNDLDPGQSVVVYTQVLVSPSAPANSTLTTTARVSTSSGDPNNANDSASASTSVRTQADLAAGLTAPSHVYQPSTSVTYAATIKNNGPSDAQAAVLTVTLPGTKVGNYVSDTGGASCTHTANTTATTVTCTYPTLAAAASHTVDVVYFFRGNAKLQNTTAKVSSATPDPITTDNTATWAVDTK
ncbi:hypothetical protein [Streptomyces sp. NPDC004788]